MRISPRRVTVVVAAGALGAATLALVLWSRRLHYAALSSGVKRPQRPCSFPPRFSADLHSLANKFVL